MSSRSVADLALGEVFDEAQAQDFALGGWEGLPGADHFQAVFDERVLVVGVAEQFDQRGGAVVGFDGFVEAAAP